MADTKTTAKPNAQSKARIIGRGPGRPVGPFRPGGRPGGSPGTTGNGSPGPQLNGRKAVFIWAYWGDTDLETMGQETMRFRKAMDGYDYKVLMKHNHTPPWLDLSEGDERRADVMLPPTRANFTSQLVALAQAGYEIDVIINGHGSRTSFTASTGTHGSNTTITEQMIRDLPRRAGLRRLPIRMVYQTQCYAASLNDAWRAAGAKVSTGARYVTFYPHRFGGFIDQWDANQSVRTANLRADTAAARTLGQVYILGDAYATRRQWGGCKFGNTVLGTKACAREYFNWRWCDPGEWQPNLSGKQNMNYSSTMITSGSSNVRKNSTNLVW